MYASQFRRLLALVALLILGLSTFAVSPTHASSSREEGGPGVMSGVRITHADAASRLRAAGITWSSSGNCSDRYNSTCTSFEQIYSGTIDGIITLKRASGCAINVTGGTETGHATTGTAPAPSYATHWNGYKIDTSLSTCIQNYVNANFTRIQNRSNGDPQWQSAAGNIYAREWNHWDIYYR
jgi:hypothetical protein